MTTHFIVDGTPKTLTMIDVRTGVDWSADFIGNTSHGMDEDEDGNYIVTQEQYDWWHNMIAAYEGMEKMIAEYRERYGDEEVDKALAYSFDVDLEDQPAHVRMDLESYFADEDEDE